MSASVSASVPSRSKMTAGVIDGSMPQPAVRIEYWFDFSCPYAYLGSTQIEALARRHRAELCWRPMLLGGVFRAVNTPQFPAETMSPGKKLHNALDMLRWAEHIGVPLRMPPAHP